jgi:phospholipid/cholesterol/gamma-HCH transport system substrate-binding protein
VHRLGFSRFSAEFSVGSFVLLGISCLAYLAFNLGGTDFGLGNDYRVTARFTSSSGLREGAFVEIGGVRSGTVRRIRLDPKTYESVVEMALDPQVRLQVDAIASIRTAGIIGDRFVKISPGGDPELIPNGGEILETEPAISLEELISKYIFEGGSRKSSAR